MRKTKCCAEITIKAESFRRPENATIVALTDCMGWISECKFNGWPPTAFQDLERLWWQHHEADGSWRKPEGKQ